MSRHRLHHFWLILAAYGVWFALFSSLEEVMNGKLWKAFLRLLFGAVTYLIIENKIGKR